MELKTTQTNKQVMQAQLEPFQQQAEQLIVELEVEKTRLKHAHTKSTELLNEHITT